MENKTGKVIYGWDNVVLPTASILLAASKNGHLSHASDRKSLPIKNMAVVLGSELLMHNSYPELAESIQVPATVCLGGSGGGGA